MSWAPRIQDLYESRVVGKSVQVVRSRHFGEHDPQFCALQSWPRPRQGVQGLKAPCRAFLGVDRVRNLKRPGVLSETHNHSRQKGSTIQGPVRLNVVWSLALGALGSEGTEEGAQGA